MDRGKLENPEKNPCSKARTKNKLNLHMALKSNLGHISGKYSGLIAAPSVLLDIPGNTCVSCKDGKHYPWWGGMGSGCGKG